MVEKTQVKAASEEQLEKEFKEYSVAEFFKKNRQMLGYTGKVRSLTTIVHEFVTNSLDSCEELGVLPEIFVEVQSASATPKKETLARGDGATQKFEVTEEVAEADVLYVFVNGIQQIARRDYDLKTEKKEKESYKVIAFKTPPAPGSTISVEWAVGHLRVVVEDNGTGIPKANIGQALGKLLAGTKFHQRKQKRGQQGIGASFSVLFSQITTGKVTKAKSGIGDGKVFECEVSVDIKKNDPIVSNLKEYASKFRGLRVEAEFAEVNYNRSEYSVYEYLRRTAVANPHAQITLIEPSKEIVVFPRSSQEVPPRPRDTKPHPLGVTTNDLIEMAHASKARKIASFLETEFVRVSSDKSNELQKMCPKIDFERSPSSLQWLEAEEVCRAMQKVKWVAPETESLVPIGEEQIMKSLKNILQPEQMKVIQRKPKVFRGGIPFQVEAAIAYGGKAGMEGNGDSKQAEIMRFANRVPLLFDSGNCAIVEAVKTIDWNRYELKNWENQPMSIFVNFVSVYVPYTGAGKLAISTEDEIVAEIRNALMDSARGIAEYLHGLQKLEDEEKRRTIFFKYIGEVSQALSEITGKAKAELEGKLREIAKIRTSLLEAAEEEALEEVGDVEENGKEEE